MAGTVTAENYAQAMVALGRLMTTMQAITATARHMAGCTRNANGYLGQIDGLRPKLGSSQQTYTDHLKRYGVDPKIVSHAATVRDAMLPTRILHAGNQIAAANQTANNIVTALEGGAEALMTHRAALKAKYGSLAGEASALGVAGEFLRQN